MNSIGPQLLKNLGLICGFTLFFGPSLTWAEVPAESIRLSRPADMPSETSVLTDPKLRAEEGSMSKRSVRFNLSYYGPTLGDLNAKEQPNPDGSVGSYSTALAGSIGVRYRFSPTRALNLGTGLKAIYPLHGVERFDVNNPSLDYEVSSRWDNLQMRNTPGINLITLPNYRAVGEYAALNFSNAFVYDFTGTQWGIGLETSLGYYLYNRPYQETDGRASLYTVSVMPSLKYRLHDRLNIYTSVALNFWSPRRQQDHSILLPRTTTQRLGVGYAWRKEIYFAPYLNFFPDRLSAESTTFNLSTIFSIL